NRPRRRSPRPGDWRRRLPIRWTTSAGARRTSAMWLRCSCSAAWPRPSRRPASARDGRSGDSQGGGMNGIAEVNGSRRTADVESRLPLVHLVRDVFGLTGTHVGCDTSNCGACTVLYDGVPVKACTMFAVQADGHAVTTVEGLGAGAALDPIQEAFKE